MSTKSNRRQRELLFVLFFVKELASLIPETSQSLSEDVTDYLRGTADKVDLETICKVSFDFILMILFEVNLVSFTRFIYLTIV